MAAHDSVFRDRVGGKLSMVRLVSFVLSLNVSALTLGLVVLAYGGKSAAVLAVIAGAITTVAGIVWKGLQERTTTDATPPEADAK